MRKFTKHLYTTVSGIAIVFFVLCVFTNSAAAAVNYNLLIEDTLFSNKDSMSVAQVDNFLDSFPQSCIRPGSGFQAVKPIGYNPSSGFIYGNYVSAGEVIVAAAQAYNINPQVLLVTLEKEQSLVTGRNNFSGYCNNGDQHKYAAAMGYGCPDSLETYSYTGINLYKRNGVVVSSTGATCVNSVSKAGFSQQIIRAAWLLKFGQERSLGHTDWAIINSNWDNSDDLHTCYGGPMTQGVFKTCPDGAAAPFDGYQTIDSQAIHMDTGATAALYWYTPHLHGNELFVTLFTNWFGPTSGYLIRTNEDGKVYIRGDGDKYYYVVSADQLIAVGYGSRIQNMLYVNKSYLNGLSFAGNLPTSVRFGDTPEVYALDNGTRYYYSFTVYQAYGQPAVGQLPGTLASLLPLGGNMQTVLRQSNAPEIYFVQGGKKRHIGGPSIYNQTYASLPSVILTSYFANTLPTGAPILATGTFTKTTDTNQYGIVNADTSTQQKIDSSTGTNITISPYTAPSVVLNQITRTDPSIGSLVKDNANNLYIVDGSHKIYLSPQLFTALGYSSNDFVTAPGAFLSAFATIAPQGPELLIRIDNNSEVYAVRQKQLWHIPTGVDFSELGYQYNNVISIRSGTSGKLFSNPGFKLMSTGTLFRIANAQTIYIVEGSTSRRVPTGTLFDQYHFSYASVLNISSVAAANYPANGDLTQIVKDPSGSSFWVIDRGTRHWMSNALATANYQVDPAILIGNSRILAPLPVSQNMSQFIRIENGSTVYKITSGKKQAMTLSAFVSLGSPWSQVVSVSTLFASSIANL